MNYRLIAIQIGDLLKYDSIVNDINIAKQYNNRDRYFYLSCNREKPQAHYLSE